MADRAGTAAVETAIKLLGKVATARFKITSSDIAAYRQRSGDTNRLHYDPEFAAQSIFRRPVAPAALLCERLPGLAVMLLGDGWAFTGISNLTVGAAIFMEEEVRVTAMVVEQEGRNAKIVARVIKDPADKVVLRADITCTYVMRKLFAASAPSQDA